jgi:uncharacterized membrane protein YhaH (DUF805 family)
MADIAASNEQIVEIAIRQVPASGVTYQSSTPYIPQINIGTSETYSGLSMGEAIKSVFSKYANFSQRATRSEYWFFALFNLLITAGLLLLGTLLANSDGSLAETSAIAGFLLLLWWAAIFIPSLAVSIRRLHDAGYSGWLYLLVLVPYLGGFVLFVFALLVSQSTDNIWGKAPKPVALAK